MMDEITIPLKPWTLNYLHWENLLCYGVNNFIDFRDLSGVSSLSGFNGTGKSAIVEILCYVLYNNVLRSNIAGIINNSAETGCVICSFTVESCEYIIRKYRNKGNDTNSLLLKYKNGKYENISGNSKEIVARVKLLIGEFDNISLNNIALQNHMLYADNNPNILHTQFMACLGLNKFNTIREKVQDVIKLNISERNIITAKK